MAKATQKLTFGGTGADSGLYAAAILDDELNTETNENGETTSKRAWYPGDPLYFLTQVDPGLRIVDVKSSWGAIQALGSVTRTHTDDITITDQPAATQVAAELSHIPSSNASLQWYGNAPTLRQDGRALYYTSGPLPAVGRAAYQAIWQSYRLIPAALTLQEDEEWPGVIVIYLEQVAND